MVFSNRCSEASIAAALLMGTFFSGSALAQTQPVSPPVSPTGAAPTPEIANGDIIVTATRREQALQDVPIAVTALTAAALTDSRVNSSADLAQLVPNLNITSQPGSFIIYLRGVGQQAINPGQEPSVATYVDGVYQPTVFGSLTSLANIERLEVIKGPQGTLFGRNATGGLINITTREPSETTSGQFSASYGNFDTLRLIGYATTGLADGVAVDFSGFYNHQDKGFGTNVVTGNRLKGTENLDLRSKLLLELGPQTTVHLAASYTRNESSVGNSLTLKPGSVGVDGSTALSGFYDIQSERDPFSRNKTYQFSGRINQEFDPFDVISITSYTNTRNRQSYDNDSTKSPIVAVDLSDRNRVFTQELQLASKKGSDLTWLAGVFYYDSLARGTPQGTGLSGLAFAPLTGVNARAVLKTTSIAVYGEATYEVLPKLNLTVGGRYTSDKKTLSGDFQYLSGSTVVQTVAVPRTSKTFKEPTYRAILDYKFAPDILGYASYSRGFKSGGFDTAFPTGIPFDPETIDAYELGLKTELFDRLLRLNIAGFYYDYKNLQLPVLVTANGVSSQITVNASNSTVKGVDLDGSLRLGSGFNLNFGFGFLDGKYKDFSNAPCTRQLANGTTQQFVCDVSGNSLIHAPKTTFNVGATYKVETAIGRFGASTNYSRLAKSYFDVADRLAQPAYGLLNGQVSWSPNGDVFTVTAFVENATNKKYTAVQFGQDAIGDTYSAASPRLYGLEVKVKF